MKKKIIMLSVILCMSLSLFGCKKTASKSHANNVDAALKSNEQADETSDGSSDDAEGKAMSGSEIFTEDIFKNVTSIEYNYGEETLAITGEDDIKSIYDMLAGLEINNYKFTATTLKGGYSMFKIITSDEDIDVGLLSGDMIVDGQCYKINENVVEEVRNIALKYQSTQE